MDTFTLDSDTVKDCAEHPAAVDGSRIQQSHPTNVHVQKLAFQDPDVQLSDRCDSAYGSECCSSTGSRLSGTGDVSERLQRLHLEQQERCERIPSTLNRDLKSSERTIGRPQTGLKRPAEETEEIVLTSDAYDQDEEGDTPLSRTIIYEKSDISLKFIRFTPDPSFFNIRNCLGQTSLMLSVLTGQVQVCRALVVAGASVDIQDQGGNTALHLACATKNFHCVQALTTAINPIEIKNTLSARNHRAPQNLTAQLGLKNYEGLTCVHLATFQGNVSLLQYLVKLGADINEPDGKSGRTALHYAVEMNIFNLVQALITTLAANVDAVTFDLCTPLHLASGRGHLDIAYMLHGAGADTQVQNYEGLCAFELTDSADLQDVITPREASDQMDYYS